jgi:hypothetical protein
MLLQLEETSQDKLKKLLEYASQLNLRLSLIDDNEVSPALPGKPLSASALQSMIEAGRKTGTISMDMAHALIRKNFNED